MTDRDTRDDKLVELLRPYEPIGTATRERLIAIGRAAMDKAPSADTEIIGAQAAISLEIGSLARLEPLVDRLVADQDAVSSQVTADATVVPSRLGPNAYPVRRRVQREIREAFGIPDYL
jgi:hypothetical protein